MAIYSIRISLEGMAWILQYRAGSAGMSITESNVNCPVENALAWMDEAGE